MGQVSSVGVSAYGFGASVGFKGSDITAKHKIEAFLVQAGVGAVKVIRQNDESVEELF